MHCLDSLHDGQPQSYRRNAGVARNCIALQQCLITQGLEASHIHRPATAKNSQLNGERISAMLP